jgi:hypothetical protein
MRMIRLVRRRFMPLLLGAFPALRAQGQQPALVGLPEHGVLLTGSPQNPETRQPSALIGKDRQ